MTKSILVTGARGFVGRHLLALLQTGEPDAVLHAWRRPVQVPAQGPEAEACWTEVDVLDRAAVRAALDAARPSEVYHLAGAAHVGQSWADSASTLRLNVLGTHLLLDELRRLGIGARVLVPGSAMVYAPSEQALTEDSRVAPTSPYALSKLAQEMLGTRAARDDGQQVLLVRAFNHVGPGQDLSFFAPSFARQLACIEAGLAPPTLHVGNLDARRDLTDVRDTVKAYHALMARGTPGRPYNVCSGQAWAIRDILAALVHQCRVRVLIEVDPSRLRPNDIPVVLGSCDRLRDQTGWRPRIPLEQTLADLLEAARAGIAVEHTNRARASH